MPAALYFLSSKYLFSDFLKLLLHAPGIVIEVVEYPLSEWAAI